MRNDIIKKIVIAVLIVIAILVMLFIGKEVAIRFFGMKTPSLSKSSSVKAEKIDISLEKNESYTHITSDKYIYFVTTDKIIVVDENGNKRTELSISVENPFVSSAGRYVVVGDVGKNNIYIIDGSEIKKEIVTAKKIKNVSINTSGNCVVVTEGDMHKREVTLYNTKGEELFVWTSGTKLVFDAVVAENNKNVIISSLDTQTANSGTTLSFYNISKEEPVEVITYENDIIADLSIYDNYVYCVGESKTDIYAVTGGKKGEIPYNTKTMLSYKLTKNGTVMSFAETTVSNKRYNVGIFAENGNMSASHDIDYTAECLDASGNYIVLIREGLISVLDYNGRELKLLDPGVDVEDLCFIGNTNKLVGFTAYGAYIIGI